MDSIIDLLRTIIYWLSTFIYKLIIDIYDIFLTLCNSRLLDNEVMAIIAQRVGLILGLIMLFILMFSVVQMILEPDKLTDKEKGVGNIAKKIIIVIVMLGVSQGAFSLLYGVQKTVIKSNIIGKFLIPYETDLENFGGSLSGQLFTSFYNMDQNVKNSSPTNVDKIAECEIAYEDLLLEISDKNFSSGKYCLNEKTKITGEKDEVYIMDLHPLLLPIAGGAALFFLFTYCITVGVRTVQLAFLEIIAPMAIISYLSPKKDTMFQKWWKLYFATYLDVFIRIAIISLAVFLIAVIFSSDMKGTFLESIDGKDGILIKVIMIFAILTFAKKAPELIKGLFPPGDSKLGLGFTTPKQMFSNMLGGNLIEKGVRTGAKVATVGTAIGLSNAITSGISRYKINKKNGKEGWDLAAGTIGGVFSGLGRGYLAGAQKGNPFSVYSKGVKAQRDLNDKYDELITSGGDIRGKMGASFSANFGETKGQEYTRQIRNNEAVANAYKAINDAAEGFKQVKIDKTAWENAKTRGGVSDADLERLYNKYKTSKKKAITAALLNQTIKTDSGAIEAEDQSIAAGITVHQAELENLVKFKNVELIHEVPDLDSNGRVRKDANGNIITKTERITTFNNYDSINDASISANTNIANIKKEDDYSAAIANDRAAGVNSNGSGKK